MTGGVIDSPIGGGAAAPEASSVPATPSASSLTPALLALAGMFLFLVGVGSMGQPTELPMACCFWPATSQSFMTGAEFVIDGGLPRPMTLHATVS